MGWVEPEGYSKSQIDEAGEILIDDKSSKLEKNNALKIVDNWRAIHSYPMHVFNMRIRRKLPHIDNKGVGVRRLKRIPSIIDKLDRSRRGKVRNLKLSQLQDLGGCRAILSDVK